MTTNGNSANGTQKDPVLPVLVVVQLSGGNDALNTVVPYNNELYYDYRRDVNIEQDKVLKLYGLPTRMPGVDREAIRRAMSVDKKTTAGNIRWVLLEDIGCAVTRNDVPEELVQAAIAEVT